MNLRIGSNFRLLWILTGALLMLGACRAAPDHLAGMTKQAQPLQGSIDRINDTVPDSGRAVVHGEHLEVQGWAVDPRKPTVGHQVYLRINDELVPCEYGIARPDVAAALDNPELTYSGYRCSPEQKHIRSGENRLRPVLTALSSKEYLEGAELHVTATR